MTWEYIAGFFDGEGSVSPNGTGFRISIPQTDLPVLQAICLFANVGSICHVTKRKAHWKESWIYYVAKQEDVRFFLEKIVLFVVIKKEKVVRVLAQLQTILASQKERRDQLQSRRLRASRLREEGLSYWRIGLIMGLDRGYVRRLVLKKWRA